MSEAKANVAREKALAGLGGALLLLTLLAAYANHFHNSFHFDDAHTIENNASIRDLRNIPLFFRDATTFSSLPSNQSYRPLVSTLVAIDYRLGGLHPFWFHLSIFAFFVALTLLLAFVVHCLLDHAASSARNRWIALAATAWYGLHPANADTVNYIIASSEVISTLGVIASFAVYLAFPRLRRSCLYIVPAAIAILAKPPAAIFAVLFAIFRLLFAGETITGRTTGRRALAYFAEIVPSFLICGGMLLFVHHMTPRTWIAGAANARNYLITQPYAALLYLKTFFWPSDLSADYDLNPFATTDDARFWVGFAFVILFITAAIATAVFKKTRVIGFGLLWFLIALLPTSLFPLAEVMNDHRTFLPYVGLVIAMAGIASLLLPQRINYNLLAKVAGGFVAAVVLSANGYATYQRNKAWKTEESLWHDVVIKSPGNARGLMNYGNTLMAKGDYTGALDYFHRAQALAPLYPVLFVNLGVAEGAIGQALEAEQHFKEALRLAPSNPDCYTYYAHWLLTQSRANDALPLLRKAVELGPADISGRDLLTKAKAEAKKAAAPATQTAEFYLARSLDRYREKRYEEAIDACRSALALKPDYAEAWNNIGASYNELGQYGQAVSACEQALRYKPDFALARNNLEFARQRMKPSGK
jgi:tetratricopeptide (TPR) repeat protein